MTRSRSLAVEDRLEGEHAAYVERVLQEDVPGQLDAIKADPSRLTTLEAAFDRLRRRRLGRSAAAE